MGHARGRGARRLGQHRKLRDDGCHGALFAASLAAARAAGVRSIDATIRADNAQGLAYYAAMGFRDWAVLTALPLADGRPVDRLRKRYDLA